MTCTENVLGTPAYMAPEQLQGKPAGPRSDLFALGLILYEMATGQLPFPGASLGGMLLIAAGSITVPPPGRVHSTTPPGLDGIIARLLEPDPSKRFRSAGEVRDRLFGLATASGRRIKTIAATAALVVFLTAFGAWVSRRGAGQSKAIGPVTAVTRITNYPGDEREPSLSPDGSQVAFSWTGDKGGQVTILSATISSCSIFRRARNDTRALAPLAVRQV